MAADLRLVAHTAEGDAHELAPERLGDALAQRRLSHARRAHEAEDRALHLLHHRLHGEVLEDALLGLLQPVVVVEYLAVQARSEEHTSELQSRLHLVCRLLLEKKKKQKYGVTRGA